MLVKLTLPATNADGYFTLEMWNKCHLQLSQQVTACLKKRPFWDMVCLTASFGYLCRAETESLGSIHLSTVHVKFNSDVCSVMNRRRNDPCSLALPCEAG